MSISETTAPHNEDSNENSYNKLLQGIGIDLSKKEKSFIKKFRSEPSKNVSMFSFSKSNVGDSNEKLNLNQLLKNTKNSGAVNTLKRKINKVEIPSKKLSAPLPKPLADRIQRKVEYKKTATDVSKWDQIVQKHRKADHLSFPLNQEPFHIKTADEFFKPKSKTLTPLEKEMYALLSNNKCVEREGKELTLMEEEALASQSLEEAREKLKQLRKHRALLLQHEAKNKRQNKIKSRQYHRMLKKQKMKQLSKQPVEEISAETYDLMRAEERASLRHRKGSKWAKRVKLMSKHENRTRSELQEHGQKRKELMRKQPKGYSSEESEEDIEREKLPRLNYQVFDAGLIKENPWLKQPQVGDNTLSPAPHKENKPENKANKTAVNNTSVSSSSDVSVKTKLKKSKQKLKESLTQLSNLESVDRSADTEPSKNFTSDKLDDLMMQTDSDLIETSSAVNENESENFNNLVSSDTSLLTSVSTSEQTLKQDINVLVNSTAKTITYRTPTLVHSDFAKEQKLSIEEAFADDGVVADFEAEKDLNASADKPKLDDGDSSLPGWGKWDGSCIKPRKKKPKPVKFDAVSTRKDANLGHVILNEKRDAYITKHQVHKLPFPFTKRNHFENYIARPVGSTWNTPESFTNAIKPKVSNPLGVVIPPLSSNELFADQEKK